MISTLRRGLLVLLAALPLMANAVAAPSAHELVQDTTNRLLADLAANKEKYKQDPKDFYDGAEQHRRACGGCRGHFQEHHDGQVLAQSHACANEDASRKTSRSGLFQFYGNALLEYNNQGITVDAGQG